MAVSLLLSSTTVFVLVTFQLLNCWTSSLTSAHTGFNRSHVTCCTLVIHYTPGGKHIYILYNYPLPPQVRGQYLNSLDLHDPISNLFRLDDWLTLSECQSGPYTAFSGGQFCFYWWTPKSEPFKHTSGQIILCICVSGHQFTLKSLQFTNTDNSIICLILPTIAKLIH